MMMIFLRVAVVLLVIGRPASAGLSPQHEGHQMAPARPQPKAEAQPKPEKILGWEPIRCWRQSTAGAVTIGEPFTVVVTCAVYEGDNAQVIPDESRLGVASIQMAPFEILGGSHPPDARRGQRRFFQYDYQLRIISTDAIGHDVNIPPLSVSYRIHSRVGAAATLDGRDLSYLMPMMPIKVLSLVPADATDIRDASDASLAAVDTLRFRSSAFQALTVTFAALAVAMVVLALVPLARARRDATPAARDRAPDRAVLAAAIGGLDEIATKVNADGWTDTHIAEALARMRLIAAVAINYPVSQKPLGADGTPPEGRTRVTSGWLRPMKAAAASAVTTEDLARARQLDAAKFSTTRQQELESLQSGLSTLTSALYRQEPERDPAAIGDAVRQAVSVAHVLHGEQSLVKVWLRR